MGGSTSVDREKLARPAPARPAAKPTGRPSPWLLSAIGNRGMNQVRELARRKRKPPASKDSTPAATGPKIKKSVGAGGKNEAADVAVVRGLLDAAGFTDPKLHVAISRFQRSVMGLAPSHADGLIGPGGATFKALTAGGGANHTRKPFWSVDDWENVLPDANVRGHIERTGAYSVKDDEAEKDRPALDDTGRAALAKIKAKRDSLSNLFTAKEKGAKGYSLGDSRPGNENATPSDVTNEADADRKKMKALIWDELGSEAALEGIQTYDNQGWGWGKGWSAMGSMSAVMDNLFALDSNAEQLLFEAGVALSGNNRGTFKMVNDQTGAIEDANDAIELMRVSPKLLSIFVMLGRDAAHKQHTIDAQWLEMQKKAGSVPDYAYKWLGVHDETLRFLAHGSHWNPNAGWEANDYSGTGGDMFKALKLFSFHLGAKRPNGALVVPASHAFGTPGKRMDHWADGKAMAALKAEVAKGKASKIVLTPAQLAGKEPSDVDGHVLIPITIGWGKLDKNQYWDLGPA
jgi:hypothetical protein